MPTPSPAGTRARRLAALVLAATAVAVAPTAAASDSAPSDSVEARPLDAFAWAREVVRVRVAVEAAEAERDPERQADAAEDVLRDAQALLNDPGLQDDRSVRDLVLRAQALYERSHGPSHIVSLSKDELAELRGEALAQIGAVPVFRDPAAVAAERQAALDAAAAEAAEAARAAGPAHLFYPSEVAALVQEQRRIAQRFAGLRTQMRRHFPSVERTLRRRGLPTDLKYVAVIESALNPNAESHAGARGMWQFMPETAADYGLDSLTVADPVASTDAAARYLQWLGRRFHGDWQLALAAYNYGVGRVERLVREHRAETGRTPTFWDIHPDLPRETQEYVPRFIAVAEMLSGRRT